MSVDNTSAGNGEGRVGDAAGAPDPAALTPDEQLLWRSLGRVNLGLPRVLDEAMVRASGLTMSEFAILDALGEAPDSTARMSDLAAATGLSVSRVSRLVDSLGGRGWCRRRRDERDGRAALAVLTEEGRARLASAAPHHRRLAREHVLSHVPPEARDAVIAALTAIAASCRP